MDRCLPAGRQVFTRNEYKDELIKCWQHCQEKKRAGIYAWCMMPGHAHMIISNHDKLSEDIVRDMKSYTSAQLRKLIKGIHKKADGMDAVDV